MATAVDDCYNNDKIFLKKFRLKHENMHKNMEEK